MLPIRLCPQTQSTSDTSDPFDSDEQWGVANRYLKELVDDRERDFETLGRFAAGHVEGDKPWSPEIKTLLEILPRSRYSQLRKPNSLMLLNECILAIVWEIQKIPWSCAIPERGKLDEIVTLLRSAAHLQAVTSTVRNLILLFALFIGKLIQSIGSIGCQITHMSQELP